jgi:CBS domain-containing protein
MKVKDLMSQPVITVHENASLDQVARTILENNVGGVPVVNSEGEITGIITESDFSAKEKSVPFSTFRAPQLLGQWISKNAIENIYQAARNRRADEIMTRKVAVLSEDDPIEKAAKMLLVHDVNRLPVIRDGKPVGIIARRDLLRLMLQNGGDV